jgi:hypothetical protein
MQRGQTPMFAREIMYTPYFSLQKRNHVGFINEFSSKTSLSLIDRMTKHLCMSVKSSTELMLYVVLTMPTLNKAYLFIFITRHDLIIVLGHPVNQGEACL